MVVTLRHGPEGPDFYQLKREFENVLDERNYTGFKRWQIFAWLIFEDSSHSSLAQVMQTWILLCIFVSTFVELVRSSVRGVATPRHVPSRAERTALRRWAKHSHNHAGATHSWVERVPRAPFARTSD